MSEAHVVVVRSGPDRPWVGQAVRLDVQLWRPVVEDEQAAPFSFDEPRVPGAIARFRDEAPPPDEMEQDGTLFLVQHRTLLVFAERDGQIEIPAIGARWNEGPKVRTARSAPLSFTAAFPPHSSEDLVVSPHVSLTQDLSRSVDALRVGDGFTRTVVLSASATDPIVLPTLEFAAVDGLSTHPGSPRDVSTAERGELKASRTFSVTYVVERVGHYDLPGLEVRWLEPASGRFYTAHAPALDFWARPNPSLGLAMWGSAGPAQLLGFGLSGALLVATVTIVWRRWHKGPFAVERWLSTWRAERRAFARFARTLRGSSATEQLEAAYAWLRARFPARRDRTLSPLRVAAPECAEELGVIERSAFDPRTGADAVDSRFTALARARTLLAKRAKSALSSARSLND